MKSEPFILLYEDNINGDNFLIQLVARKRLMDVGYIFKHF